MSRTIFLFAGQGSQYYGLGQPLFAENRVFREVPRDLDDVARGLLGRSILEVLHAPRSESA